MVWQGHVCNCNMERRCSTILAYSSSRSFKGKTWPMASKHSSTKSYSRAGIYLGRQKTYPWSTECGRECTTHWIARGDPKTIAEACMRHGYCTADLIVWYVMKQLILPPDINEVTMQKEILTHPKVSPATLDQACAWLEERYNIDWIYASNQSRMCIQGLLWHLRMTPSVASHSTIVQLGISGTVSMQSINCVSPTSLWIGSTPCLQSSSLNWSCMRSKTKLLR